MPNQTKTTWIICCLGNLHRRLTQEAAVNWGHFSSSYHLNRTLSTLLLLPLCLDCGSLWKDTLVGKNNMEQRIHWSDLLCRVLIWPYVYCKIAGCEQYVFLGLACSVWSRSGWAWRCLHFKHICHLNLRTLVKLHLEEVSANILPLSQRLASLPRLPGGLGWEQDLTLSRLILPSLS